MEQLPPGSIVRRGRSDTIGAFAAALAKAQLEMGTAKKNATNPHFKSKYADLEAVADVGLKPLAKNGIAFTQDPVAIPGWAGVVTELIHSSGEFKWCELLIPTAQATAHAIGSAITYARRFSMSAMLGIPTGEGDDDGNEAVGGGSKDEGRKEAPRQQAAKTSRTEEAKAKLAAKPVWGRLVDLGAMYGKTEEQMTSFCKDKLAGKTKAQLTEEDYAHVHDALARVHKPIVGTNTGIHTEPIQ